MQIKELNCYYNKLMCPERKESYIRKEGMLVCNRQEERNDRMQQLRPAMLQWTLSLPTPRPMDTNILEEALGLYFPRPLRWIFAALPFLLLISMGLAMSIMASTGRYGDELRLWLGPTAAAQGQITEVTRHQRAKGGDLYIHEFQFQPFGASGQPRTFKGVSYAENRLASTGQTVEIEYLESDPGVCVLKGGRMAPSPLVILLMVPLVGIMAGGLPLFVLRYQKKRLTQLLIHGMLTSATVAKVHSPVKGSCRVDLSIPLRADGKPTRITVPAHAWVLEWVRHHEASGEPVQVLVDAKRFKSAFLPDLLLKNPKRANEAGL